MDLTHALLFINRFFFVLCHCNILKFVFYFTARDATAHFFCSDGFYFIFFCVCFLNFCISLGRWNRKITKWIITLPSLRNYYQGYFVTAVNLLTGVEKKRQDSIAELISTEQAYIDDMSIVHEVSSFALFNLTFVPCNLI